MAAAADVVRALFERMEARDRDGAAEPSDAVHIEFTDTAEHFDGDNFLAMNRAGSPRTRRPRRLGASGS